MATFTWSATPGNPPVLAAGSDELGVTENNPGATSKVSEAVEITVDLGSTMDGNSRVITREEVQAAVLRLANYIDQHSWPPV